MARKIKKLTDQQVIDAYNGGDTDPASIGRTFNCHWRKIQAVLDNNADKLK